MAKKLDCPNATQKNITDLIQCKLGQQCAYQFPCSLVGGNVLSNGHHTCTGKNKTPPANTK